MRQGTPGRWDPSNLPWHWSYLDTMHRKCEAILSDWTLRDTDSHPPPKSMWFEDEELDSWRKDMERAREQQRGQ